MWTQTDKKIELYLDDDLLVRLSVQVEAEVDITTGEPVVIVQKIMFAGTNLLAIAPICADPLFARIGNVLKAQMEADEEWKARQIDAVGLEYRGRGANDPAGCWVVRKD